MELRLFLAGALALALYGAVMMCNAQPPCHSDAECEEYCHKMNLDNCELPY